MKLQKAISNLMVLFTISVGAVFSPAGFAQEKPRAKVFKLDSAGNREMQLLSGPPETVSMRSGLITLQPRQTVGKHSTGQHEEMLVVLEGEGKMLFHDGSSLAIAGNQALYCPPETEHDVVNTGKSPLRYVYIVASTKLRP